jgi:hypothetical protein
MFYLRATKNGPRRVVLVHEIKGGLPTEQIEDEPPPRPCFRVRDEVPFGKADNAALTPSIFLPINSFSLSSGVLAALNFWAHSDHFLSATSRVCSVAFSSSEAIPSFTIRYAALGVLLA